MEKKLIIMIDGQEYLTFSQANELTGFYPMKISRLCSKGVLRKAHLSKKDFVYNKEDLIKILESEKQAAKNLIEEAEVRLERDSRGRINY